MSGTRQTTRSMADRLGIEVNPNATRQPPVNLRAEQSLLGAILSNNKAFGKVADFLEPAHFADPVMGRIYAECARRILAGQVADPVTLVNWFRADPDAAEVGGVKFLVDLLSAMVGVMNAADYGRQIRDCWVRRETINAAQDLIDEAYLDDGDVEGGLGKLNHTIDVAMTTERADVVMFADAMTTALDRVDEARRCSGAVGLNIGSEFRRTRAAVRFISGRLILVGGATGAGKSALVWRWAVNGAVDIRERVANGTPMSSIGGILGVSMEMDAAAIALRAACSYGGVPYDQAEAGTITQFQRDILEDARAALGKLPIVFIAVGGMTPGMVRMRARQAQRRFGGKLAAIVIDHLQLMDAETDAARGGGAWAMKSIINTLIDFPKQFDCPVIALSQLKGEIDDRANKRPHSGDYAWGKSLGQAADYGIFIYREEYYLRRNKPFQILGEAPHLYQERLDTWQAAIDRMTGKAELIVDKARGGMGRTIDMLFDGPTMTFSEDPSL